MGKLIPCSTSSGRFNSSDGCYYAVADPPPTSGPVYAEYKTRGGTILFASCPFGGSGGFVWAPRAPGQPQVTAAQVRAEVVRQILPAEIGLAPKTATLVNIDTIMWVDAPPTRQLRLVQILGHKVQITISVSSVSWNFGDGMTDSAGPTGNAYTDRVPCRTKQCPSYYFSHEYLHRGAVHLAATVTWQAEFTVDGGGTQQAGQVAGPQADAQLAVKEARGILVPNPGEH